MLDEALQGRRPVEADLLGRVFQGRYQVTALLGKGGMGWVFRARHLKLGQEVALKVLRRDVGDDLRLVKRFFLEARTCAQLRHPHTIRVHDFGESEDGFLYLAMEFLAGHPLSRHIARGPLDPRRAARLAMQVCQSLDEAHDAGLVHRDLKPDNIFLCKIHKLDDFVKVLDFGIAKLAEGAGGERLTATGTVVGTPSYLSPEQAQGLPLDRRSDLFALGVTLHEMLTGQPPFEGPSAVATLGKIVLEPPPPLPASVAGQPVPPALRELIEQLLAKQPAARPASAEEAAHRLEAFAGDPTSGVGRLVPRPHGAPAGSPAAPAPGPVDDQAPTVIGLEPPPLPVATLPTGRAAARPGPPLLVVVLIVLLVGIGLGGLTAGLVFLGSSGEAGDATPAPAATAAP
jgi:serine/threonine-protein kinase